MSISETDQQDVWQNTCLSCSAVSNTRINIEQSFQNVIKFIEAHWPDEVILQSDIEII